VEEQAWWCARGGRRGAVEGERWKGGKEVNAVMQVMKVMEGRREGERESEKGDGRNKN